MEMLCRGAESQHMLSPTCASSPAGTAWGGRFGKPRNLPALHLLFVSVHAAAEEKAIKPFRGSRDRCHTDQISSWETLGESVIL